MKQLLLVRHAKSDWNNQDLSDFDRPLNKRGERNAPEMALRLLDKHFVPQAIISSPALRALSTARSFADIFNMDENSIIKEPKIYEASLKTLLSLVNSVDNKYNFIAIFGHNPGITNLAIELCDTNVYDMPTCGVMLIEFPFYDWSMISKGTGIKKLYDFPKNEDD